MAKIETETMTEMFNKMSQMCGKKCFVKYNDGDLAVGEMVCIDRCVGKYMQAQEKVGSVLNSFEQQMKAQETANAAVAAPTNFGNQ
eukprot:CAMPEP_0119042916 /NCGR_PEP_ID=MMETSP1177-20130426/16271_1 /TAXON_ID=2985 /ORGANISM="Ochromonas sp, Strain CCMP1899" /LENGTH=85 /DNA_ID=CAMNT_0007010023 /DNA_START=121 /DNA_END=378 /DNA_ORIENTATION=-